MHSQMKEGEHDHSHDDDATGFAAGEQQDPMTMLNGSFAVGSLSPYGQQRRMIRSLKMQKSRNGNILFQVKVIGILILRSSDFPHAHHDRIVKPTSLSVLVATDLPHLQVEDSGRASSDGIGAGHIHQARQ